LLVLPGPVAGDEDRRLVGVPAVEGLRREAGAPGDAVRVGAGEAMVVELRHRRLAQPHVGRNAVSESPWHWECDIDITSDIQITGDRLALGTRRAGWIGDGGGRRRAD